MNKREYFIQENPIYGGLSHIVVGIFSKNDETDHTFIIDMNQDGITIAPEMTIAWDMFGHLHLFQDMFQAFSALSTDNKPTVEQICALLNQCGINEVTINELMNRNEPC